MLVIWTRIRKEESLFGLKRIWYISKWRQDFNEVLLEKGAEKWLEENIGSRKVFFFFFFKVRYVC